VRAIDLYAGIGGWSLGLRLAGIDVVASYEWWQPAIDTHNGNHGGNLAPTDIRKLKLADLPHDIDLVVGSPPCTEFSYANRGGSGDISEGMKDLVKFFEVVKHLKPRFWAMENVPRVAQVLTEGFADPEHELYRFRDLKPHIEVVDFSEFGAAQARKRCIAGNIPFELIRSYQPHLNSKTLGDVVAAFAATKQVVDPIWGTKLAAAALTETQAEPLLNAEELRMNRESKAFHPVYNNMAFPDPLDEPSRTVTATCTRVSRESIVIADPKGGDGFRRLTIRERASLQGFPITYQFYARSFAEKAKMVGNAIPPTFTYLLALAAQGIREGEFKRDHTFAHAGATLALPEKKAKVTPPDGEGRTYPETRSFRAALPNLRFKSGMRFDLSNDFTSGAAEWRVRFFFGSSKKIAEIDLNGRISAELRSRPWLAPVLSQIRGKLMKLEGEFNTFSPQELQSVWNHRSKGTSPFEVADWLGELADQVHASLVQSSSFATQELAAAYVAGAAQAAWNEAEKLPALTKLERNAVRIISGFIVADWFNTLDWHRTRKQAA
jgi:DNA (cytosine-5)-methyltransferase 1